MATLYDSGELTVSVDTFIRNPDKTTSYGTDTYIVLGQRPSWSQDDVALLKFNSMPISVANGVIVPQSADLFLACFTTTSTEASGFMKIGRCTAAFNNSSTWDSMISNRASEVDYVYWERPPVGEYAWFDMIETYKAIVAAGVNYGFWMGNSHDGAYRAASLEDNLPAPTLVCTYYIQRNYTGTSENTNYVTVTGLPAGGSFTLYDGNTYTLNASLKTITGYTTIFDGWYLNGVFKSNSLSYTITGGSDTFGSWVARAHIVANTYTATFDKNGGTGGSDTATVTFDGALPNITPPSRTGYTFMGYTYNSIQYWNASGVGLRNWTTTSNATLVAGWTLNTYNITASKGTNVLSTSGGGSIGYGSPVTIDCVLDTILGYTTAFTGWTSNNTSLVPNSLNKSYTFNCPGGDITLTANASKTANTYSISYNGNGNTGGSTATSSHTYDTAKNLTANGFTKTGYTFIGWATSPTGSVVYANNASVINLLSTQGGSLTLYAKWTANSYTAAFNAGLGTIVGNSSQSVTYDSALGTLPVATRIGYDFGGWWTGAGGTGTQVSSSTIFQSTSNVTYYAKWAGSGRVWSNTGTKKFKGVVTYSWSGNEWTIPS